MFTLDASVSSSIITEPAARATPSTSSIWAMTSVESGSVLKPAIALGAATITLSA